MPPPSKYTMSICFSGTTEIVGRSLFFFSAILLIIISIIRSDIFRLPIETLSYWMPQAIRTMFPTCLPQLLWPMQPY